MADTSSRAAALIALETSRDRRVAELAMLISLAAQIEPELLRAMRLDALPTATAAVEADLWFSPLVQARDPDGLVLLPDVAEQLRSDLAKADNQEKCTAAWRVISVLHARHSPMLRLEELVRYLSVRGDIVAMERELGVAFAALQKSSDDLLARWVARRLPQLPAAARATEPAMALARVASRRLGGAPIRGALQAGASEAPWTAQLLASLPTLPVGLRMFTSGLELAQPPRDSTDATVVVPQTTPLLIDVEHPTPLGWDLERVTLAPAAAARVGIASGSKVRVKTAAGEEFSFRPVAGRAAPIACMLELRSTQVTTELVDLGWQVQSRLASNDQGAFDVDVVLLDEHSIDARLPVLIQDVPVYLVSERALQRLEAPHAPSRDYQNMCVVVMPFGKKEVGAGRTVDFDAVYEHIVRPAVASIVTPGSQGGHFEPVRMDSELRSGDLEDEGVEYMIQARLALVDTVGLAANVVYELGVRSRLNPTSRTLLITQDPETSVTLGELKTIEYKFGSPEDAEQAREIISRALKTMLEETTGDASGTALPAAWRSHLESERFRLHQRETPSLQPLGQQLRRELLLLDQLRAEKWVARRATPPDVKLGATPTTDGVTFSVWAPRAEAVYIATDSDETRGWLQWSPHPAHRMIRDANGIWRGFVSGLRDGDPYLFWVKGAGSEGFKRDPYARELALDPPFPNGPCLVRGASYAWHDEGWQPPPHDELVIYQLHVGVYYATGEAGDDQRASRSGTFLDLVNRIEYLADLSVNAVQLLPIQVVSHAPSLGYNAVDMFAPALSYLAKPSEIARALGSVNRLLGKFGHPPLSADDLTPGVNQLKVVIDLFHLHGIAVMLQTVISHGGGDFDDRSLYFFDRQPIGNNNDSLYFTDVGHAGGLVFAYRNELVRKFLIDNALYLLGELHVDGLSYDDVGVVDANRGYGFCQRLTEAVRRAYPDRLQIAEFWGHRDAALRQTQAGGFGFDAVVDDGLRDAVRAIVIEAAGGGSASVNLNRLSEALSAPQKAEPWRLVTQLETEYPTDSPLGRRLAAIADPSNAASWYARSRARVATGLLLTASGTPLIFMGQEILEDKPWSDDVVRHPERRIDWKRLEDDSASIDFLRFIRELIKVRRALPPLRGEFVRVFHVANDNRVLAFHRRHQGAHEEAVVVVSFKETPFPSYDLGFPSAGVWTEIFNSDRFENLPNFVGNPSGAATTGPAMHGFRQSATIAIPANAIQIFLKRGGEATASV